jgi:hypothetical protein
MGRDCRIVASGACDLKKCLPDFQQKAGSQAGYAESIPQGPVKVRNEENIADEFLT